MAEHGSAFIGAHQGGWWRVWQCGKQARHRDQPATANGGIDNARDKSQRDQQQ